MSRQWEDHTRALTKAQQAVERAEQNRAMLVAAARFAGVPWSVIGHALGVSKQAAQQRFS